MTEKILLKPTDASYAVTPPDEVIYAKLDGGAGFYRADIDGGSSLVNVTWICNVDDYQYLWAFFRRKTDRGASPFLIDLMIEDAALYEYTASFIPGSLQTTQKDGGVYSVTAQLEALAREFDTGVDDSVLAVYEASGGKPMIYIDLLDDIVNHTLPGLPS